MLTTYPAPLDRSPGGMFRKYVRPVVEHQPHVRDVLTAAHRRDHGQGGPETVGELAREAPALPGSLPLVQALSQMRRHGHMAIVIDEYGGTDGIVSSSATEGAVGVWLRM